MMAANCKGSITLVNKDRYEVIFVESEVDFVNALFSFLAITMGTLIGLGHSHPVPNGIGAKI
ncbi:unnamed protein product [Prunus armeniaca]